MIKREERQIISDNLKALLNQNKKKRTEVANDLNVKYSTFCDWVRARTAPDANQVKELANYFHVSVGEITNRNEDHKSISDAEILDSKVRITVFKTVERADGSTAYDTDYEYIDKYICGSHESIGFRLDDDSMEPEYHKGDIIIARKVKFMDNNADYLVDTSSQSEWFPELRLVRVYQKGSKVLIAPLNNDNEKGYIPERLNQMEYSKKYHNIYAVTRLIRNYK